jgi:hypothetical protein
MSTPATPSGPQPSVDDRNLVPTGPATATFEDKANAFWDKNRGLLIGLCVAVVVLLIGKGAWDHLAAQKELEIEKAFAAATTNEQLKAFAAANSGHSLAGIAQLRIADEAYVAGKSADAVAAYDLAIAQIKSGPLASRALLGRALAKAQAGKGNEATAELKQLASDANQPKPLRVEASYHLASLAAEARNADEVQKLADQIMQLDPTSGWAARAMALRASLPAPAAPAAAAPAAAKATAAPAIKVPGK